MNSADDVEIMFRELSQRDVLSKIPGRCHSTFPNHPQNLKTFHFHNVNDTLYSAFWRTSSVVKTVSQFSTICFTMLGKNPLPWSGERREVVFNSDAQL